MQKINTETNVKKKKTEQENMKTKDIIICMKKRKKS